MNSLKGLGVEIGNVKRGLDLPLGDLEILQGLTNDQSDIVKLDTQIKSLFLKKDDAEKNFDLNPTWAHRARLDATQLMQRALVCEDIKESVFGPWMRSPRTCASKKSGRRLSRA